MEEPAASSRWIRLHSVTRPALVLGSAQNADCVDRNRAADADAEIVRRRSGGGAVLISPGGQVWADFFVPAGDPLWDHDVARSAHWAGKVWASTLTSVTGHAAVVHTSGLQADEWGRLVCFAGIGPGEVFVLNRKAVGVSQNRNRHRIRIQTMARVVRNAASGDWRCGDIDELYMLDLSLSKRAEGRRILASRSTAVSVGASAVTAALLAQLGQLPASDPL